MQTTWKGGDTRRAGAMIVAHLDARLVIERLNAVAPDMWTEDFKPFGNLLMCELTVDGVTRRDVGEGQGKALVSDALKRAAVKFGIGVSVYALPRVELYVGGKDSELRTRRAFNRKDKVWEDVPTIDARTLERLKVGYDNWLERTGEHMFGPVLDHGWEADAVGDEDETPVEEPPAPEEAVLPALESVEAKARTEEIKSVYAIVRAAAPRRLPPGEFQRKLAGAAHSMEALAELKAELEALRDEVQEQAA